MFLTGLIFTRPINKNIQTRYKRANIQSMFDAISNEKCVKYFENVLLFIS